VTVSIAVVCEAAADKRTGCELADRVICEAADWIAAEVIESYRRYRGFEVHDEFLRWIQVPDMALALGIRAHGHFDGLPGAPDALATRRALLILKHAPTPPDAVILLRDSDREPQRELGMKQARDEYRKRSPTPIVIGLAKVKRECWVLAGFLPENPEEQTKLDAIRGRDQLGFDPILRAERLTAKTPTAKKNAKRILKLLTKGDPDRERRCWQDAPLQLLKDRGRNVGLSEYFQELDDLLLPLFTA